MASSAPLAISLGDPAGVGPELIAAAWAARSQERLPPFFVVEGKELLSQAAASRHLKVPLAPISEPAEAAQEFTHSLPVLGSADFGWNPGQPTHDGAQLALASLIWATRLARSGEASGLVTAPVAKSRLAEIGFTQPGQTEFVADACGVGREDAVTLRQALLDAAPVPPGAEQPVQQQDGAALPHLDHVEAQCPTPLPRR